MLVLFVHHHEFKVAVAKRPRPAVVGAVRGGFGSGRLLEHARDETAELRSSPDNKKTISKERPKRFLGKLKRFKKCFRYISVPYFSYPI